MKTAVFLVLSFLLLAGMIPLSLASLPQVTLPSGVTLAVQAGTKLHLGDKWVYPQTYAIRITDWLEDNWINYTVAGAGSQQIYYGAEPIATYIDGTHHGNGDGWTYVSGTTTVTTAASFVALSFASTVPIVPQLPQTATGQTVHFIVTLNFQPVEGCTIKLYDNATNEYLVTAITREKGTVDVFLASGTYHYEAEYKDKRVMGDWLHVEEETIRIVFSPSGTGGQVTIEPKIRVIQIAIAALIVVGAVFALFAVRKRVMG